MSRWLPILLISASLTGCSLYRAELAQGNHIEQNSLNQLTPGLTKHQVQQIMGTPALTPVFELERWHYTYAYIDGRHRDQKLKYETVTLYFKNDKLESYSSNHWKLTGLPRHQN
jgi:outer membrane protein assembly factor BamE